MYKVEEKDSLEVFMIRCRVNLRSPLQTKVGVTAYTLDEAKQKCLDMGYDVLD